MYLNLENVVPGMTLERNIISEGVTLINAGAEISEKSLELLRGKNVKGVYIKMDDDAQGGFGGDQVIYKYAYKDYIDYKALSAAKGLLLSAKSFKESIFPVLKEVIEKSTEWLNSIDSSVEMDELLMARGVNTCILAVVLASRLEMSNDELLSIGYASIFSDIGMLWVPKEIRHKENPLNKGERELIRSHCRLGLDYARKYFNLPLSAYQAILDHQERWDGSGYPEGRKGENISKYARIIMIADVYDSLTRGTPYRPPFSPAEAIEYLMGGSGILFDSRYVNEFVNQIEPYPEGAIVKLSDGSRGTVHSVKLSKMRPVIKLENGSGEPEREEVFINLAARQHLNLTISEVVEFAIPHL